MWGFQAEQPAQAFLYEYLPDGFYVYRLLSSSPSATVEDILKNGKIVIGLNATRYFLEIPLCLLDIVLQAQGKSKIQTTHKISKCLSSNISSNTSKNF